MSQQPLPSLEVYEYHRIRRVKLGDPTVFNRYDTCGSWLRQWFPWLYR